MGSILSFFGAKNNFGWIPLIICSMLGPIGHLILRVVYLNGSLDKSWLFIPGSIPPISIIANIAMKYGFVAQGPGQDVIDRWVLVPIIIKFMVAILLTITHKSTDMIYNIIGLGAVLLATIIPNYKRMYESCDKNVTGTKLIKSVADSYIEFGTAYFFPILLQLITKIIRPLRIVTMLLDKLPMSEHILWSVGFVCSYTITNMINQDDMKTYCNEPNKNIMKTLVLCIISTLIIIYNFHKNGITSHRKHKKHGKHGNKRKHGKKRKHHQSQPSDEQLSTSYESQSSTSYEQPYDPPPAY